MTLERIVRLSKKGQLVLPKTIRDGLGVKEGDRLIILKKDDYVILTTPEKFAAATRGILKDTWGKSKEEIEAYLDGERESWE